MRVNTQLAYILHKRAYGETSQILEVFSRDHGRLSLMSKGSRSAKSKTSGLLQAFRPLLLGWQGRGEMPTLCESDRAVIKPPQLSGKALLSALYLNELLINLLHRHDVHQNVFAHYHDALYALAEQPSLENVLRRFEINLLEEIGFALNLSHDADSGAELDAGAEYLYYLEHGPVQCRPGQVMGNQPRLTGAALIALQQDQFIAEHAIQVKQLLRFVLQHHLGSRRLKTRELFKIPASQG